MPVSIAECQEFLNSPKYARFVHTNLHLHTPATRWDWDGREGQTKSASTLTPELYFDALNKSSLELVAITDHNCVTWCQALVSLARTARSDGRSKIHVLPGVELSTYEGPHLLAIFDENQDINELNLMIARLGMSGRGDQNDRVGEKSDRTITIGDILGEVEQLGGIVVAPHVNEKDGLWGPKEFKGRNGALNDRRLRILAAPSGDIKRVKDEAGRVRLLYKNMDSTLITNSFGFINVSDCHRLEDFETNTTWIKMTTPSLEGVRQVIYEPELRVSHQIIDIDQKVEYPESFHFIQPSEPSHPYILGASITGGMLNGAKVAFSPNQNCIIGRNYAGKSALLDCLRFVLGAEPSDPDDQDKFASRILAFAGEGGEVRAYVRDRAAKIFGISRVFSASRSGRRLRIDGAPDVFQMWNDAELRRESDLQAHNVFPLEIYPQGEVVKIKDNVGQQMKIVDSLAENDSDLRQLTREEYDGERTVLGRMADNRNLIVSQCEKRDSLAEDTSGIQQLADEIAQLEALTTSASYLEKKQWADIEIKIDGYSKRLLRVEKNWLSDGLVPALTDEDRQGDKPGELPVLGKAKEIDKSVATPDEFSTYSRQIYDGAVGQLNSGVAAGRQTLREAIGELGQVEDSRRQREEQADKKIAENLEPGELPTKGDILISRITEKRKRLNELLNMQGELETTKAVLAGLERAREALLKEFEAGWSRVHERRVAVVNMIQAACGPRIRAELISGGDNQQYRELLDRIADGLTSTENRISRRESQLNDICGNVPPKVLAEVARKGDANQLTMLCPSVTPNTARVLLGMGSSALLRLEECGINDSFAIGYMRDGDTAFTRVDLGLSGGEQALALISVAMVPKPLPLVVDQPEDELGPALITQELVEQVRRVKSSRQLVFVTHVANIPVLADSEQVIYMEQEVTEASKTSSTRCCGSLDDEDIVRHLLDLDGGPVAFEKRSERYSSVISRR